MGKIGKITPEQLRTAKRVLRELPVKDTRCSREEAAKFLEKDLKRAFRKGYTPKELCALLKKAGIIISEGLLVRYQEPAEKDRKNSGFTPERILGSVESSSPDHPYQAANIMAAKGITPSAANRVSSVSKTEPIGYWESALIAGTLRAKKRRKIPAPSFEGSKENEGIDARFLTQIGCHVKPVNMGEPKMIIAVG